MNGETAAVSSPPAAVGGNIPPGALGRDQGSRRYPMARLIRGTLLLLYLALVLPLPLLAPDGLRLLLTLAVPVGLGLVLALTSERVTLDAQGLRVDHPRWCAWWLRRGWSLDWPEVAALTPVRTSQAGRVFYVRTRDASAAYLLPQRVENFEEFVQRFSEATGLDCGGVGRLTPAWTYQLLAVLSAVLLSAELAALLILPRPFLTP